MRRLICLSLLILLALYAPLGWNQAKGVSSRQLSRTLLPEDQLPIEPGAHEALSQSFSYWGKGSQSYVFLSKDGQFVLKIPRLSKMKSGLVKRVFKRNRDRVDLLNSLKIAGQNLARETALVYVHYGNNGDSFPKTFSLLDRLGRCLEADLASLPFALQERKELLSSALLRADREEAEKILSAYLDLIGEEKNRGWMSRDRAFWLNFGYETNRAVRIDIGSYVPLKNFSWHQTAKPVCHWLKEVNPPLSSWFDEELFKRERVE